MTAALVTTLAVAGLCGAVAQNAVGATTAAKKAKTLKVQEKFTVPGSGSLKLVGHGWGHGHGMSQWGAAGAAAQGLTHGQIMAFYYPGTKAKDIGNPTIKVALASQHAANSKNIHIAAPGSIVFYNEASRKHHTYASTKTWRVIRSGGKFLAQVKSGSSWSTRLSMTGPIHVDTSATTNHVTYPVDRRYTGWLRLVPDGSGFMTVANVSMDNYLKGVVPSESISSWPVEALAAQAIAARTYAAYHFAHPRSSSYQVYDTTSDQVFTGTDERTSRTDTAVTMTTGDIRTYGGSPILAQFSSSNGGWSTDGGEPYLTAEKDPYDGVLANSVHSWSATLPASALQRAYPSIGVLTSLTITERDGNGAYGGRVLKVRLTGSEGSVTVSGDDVYHAYAWPSHSKGLRSRWWDVTTS